MQGCREAGRRRHTLASTQYRPGWGRCTRTRSRTARVARGGSWSGPQRGWGAIGSTVVVEGRSAGGLGCGCVVLVAGRSGAVTWKGFSNRAGLSSTVTFVTVTHAILEPHPSTAKAQARREVCGTKEGTRSVEGGARTRACRNWWGLEIGRAGRAYTRMRARDTHLQGSWPLCPGGALPRNAGGRALRAEDRRYQANASR